MITIHSINYLTPHEAAEKTGLSYTAFRKAAVRHQVPYTTVGTSKMYPVHEIQALASTYVRKPSRAKEKAS